MTVSPKKFQTMFVSKTKNSIPEDLNICVDDVYIKPQTSVTLLDITSESHISSICKCASCQLNALFRFKNVLGFSERKISSFNYFPLVELLCNQKSSQ